MKASNSVRVEVMKAMQENTRRLYKVRGEMSEKDKGYIQGLQTAIWMLNDREYLKEMIDIYMK